MAVYQIPCTACCDCLPCPAGINIPEVFAAYNRFLSGEQDGAAAAYSAQQNTAGDCIRCARCEKLCPSGIGISAMMLEIDEEMGEQMSCKG